MNVRGPVLLTTIVAGMMAMLTPSSAEARVFIWSKNGNGTWTDPANWTWSPDGTDPGPGYPDGPGDFAIFSASYTVDIRVFIPNGGNVTVGELVFRRRQSHSGSTVSGTLTFDNNGTAAKFTAFGNLGNVQHSFTALVHLKSDLAMTFTAGTSLRTIEIDEVGGARALTKRGPGTLVRTAPGFYTGPTIVEDGWMQLNALNATSQTLRGNLIVGDGIGALATALVTVSPGGQIVNTADITVLNDGKLELIHHEQVDEVTVIGGQVFSRSASRFGMKRLTMTGGLLFAVQGGSFTLEGPFTATSSAAGPAVLQREQLSNTSSFNLAGDVRKFVVNNGPLAVDLQIEIPLSGTGSSGVQKEGVGTMRFSGPVRQYLYGRDDRA